MVNRRVGGSIFSYTIHVLDATGNNRKRTAEILGINRKTLYRMAARFEIAFG